jgi:hypothetical protein
MCLQPKSASSFGRIDMRLIPPGGFVTAAMHFAMMSATERDRELVADLAAERRYLGKTQIMGISRPPAADEARLLGY